LLVAQTAGGVACFASLLDLAGTMLVGQLVFQLAFTASVVAALTAELGPPDRPSGLVHHRPGGHVHHRSRAHRH
jgi:hypothetical protein